MNEDQFRNLLERYINDKLSAEEVSLFVSYLRENNDTGQLEEVIEQALHNDSFTALSAQLKSENIFQKILEQAKGIERPFMPGEPSIKPENSFSRKRILRWIAAASLLIGIPASIYFVFTEQSKNEIPVATINEGKTIPVTDADPGTNRAVLKLADGKELILDSVETGAIAQQDHSTILKTGDGQLAYNTSGESSAEAVYNTLFTPRGGQYQLTLPDGSKVWLNAASSLRFPVAFREKDRVVELTGEAYFEIAQLKTQSGEHRPFMVRSGSQDAGAAWQVEVLGTHFNIMDYDNEKAIRTSLLEGSVKVYAPASGRPAVKISPGQQAVLTRDDAEMKVYNADVESDIAWKNGLFRFNSDDIQYIMRQLERWYDVNAVYTGKIPVGHYSGVVDRNNRLSTVLRILEESGLHFKIQDKMLTILPQ